jgi:hypothetical protein
MPETVAPEVLTITLDLNEKLDAFLKRAHEAQRNTNHPIVLAIPAYHVPYSGVHVPNFTFGNLQQVLFRIEDRHPETMPQIASLFTHPRYSIEDVITLPLKADADTESVMIEIQDKFEITDFAILAQLYHGRDDYRVIDMLCRHNALPAAIEYVRQLRLKKQHLFKNPPADLGSVENAAAVHQWLNDVLVNIYDHHWNDAVEFPLAAVAGPAAPHHISCMYWVKRPDGTRFPPAGLFLSEDKTQLQVTGLDLQITRSFQRHEFVPALEKFFAHNPQFSVPPDGDVMYDGFEQFLSEKKTRTKLSLEDVRDANVMIIGLELHGRAHGRDMWTFLNAVRTLVWQKNRTQPPAPMPISRLVPSA